MRHSARNGGVGSRLQVACLAALFAFHAAAYTYVGRAYFYVTGLNDSSRPPSLNVLLQPALLAAALVLLLRWRRLGASSTSGHKGGLVTAMGLWLVGATLGWIANSDAPLVTMTYWSVFACGAAVYVAARGLEPTDRQVDLIFLALIAGALLPLGLGIRMFVAEWGVPDLPTVMTAHLDLLRMSAYEEATFGNRGNTGGFLVIVLPAALCLLLDRERPRLVRLACALFLAVGIANLMIIQVRAAFLSLLFAAALVWRFRSRPASGYAVLLIGSAIAMAAVTRYAPEITQLVAERYQPVLTLAIDNDASLAGRTAAIEEGWRIASRNWTVGIGPGAGLTEHSMTAAHQLQVQQGMEAGMLGLAGSTLFVLALLAAVRRAIAYGPADPVNRRRFLFLMGPTTFGVYGVVANVTLNVGYINTWTVLVVAMLALMPPFPAGRVPFRVPMSVVARRQRLFGTA